MGRWGRSGFTLVEVIVALAVGGIVLLTGFGALATVRDRSEHVMAETSLMLEGATARTTLIEWLGMARLQASELNAAFSGLDAVESDLPSDEVTFPTRARTPLGTPTTVVRLFVDTDFETPERGLVAEFVGALGAEPRRMELVSNVTGMRIRYLPDVAGDVEWSESWVGQSELPRAIEISLDGRPPDSLPALLTLPIRVPLTTLR